MSDPLLALMKQVVDAQSGIRINIWKHGKKYQANVSDASGSSWATCSGTDLMRTLDEAMQSRARATRSTHPLPVVVQDDDFDPLGDVDEPFDPLG